LRSHSVNFAICGTANLPTYSGRNREPLLEDKFPTCWKTVSAQVVTI
jgi:hypothetical protein